MAKMPTLNSIELTDIFTVAGTAREVSERLSQAKNQQVVAFILPHVSVPQREAIGRTLETLIRLTAGCQISRDREVLGSLVNALMQPILQPESVLRDAVMISKARAEVLEGSEWLSAAQLATLAGMSPVNPNAQPSRWKRDGRIFSIKPLGSVELFPAYGLDPSKGFRPRKDLAEIITILSDRKDGWGLAYWFSSLNSFLGGRRPQDVLATAPREVVAAAADEAEDIVHG